MFSVSLTIGFEISDGIAGCTTGSIVVALVFMRVDAYKVPIHNYLPIRPETMCHTLQVISFRYKINSLTLKPRLGGKNQLK